MFLEVSQVSIRHRSQIHAVHYILHYKQFEGMFTKKILGSRIAVKSLGWTNGQIVEAVGCTEIPLELNFLDAHQFSIGLKKTLETKKLLEINWD